MEAYLACTEEKNVQKWTLSPKRYSDGVQSRKKNSPTKSINALFVYYLSNSDSVTEFLRMSHAFSHFFTRLHVDCRVASAAFCRQSRRVVVIETEIPWAFDFTTCSVYISFLSDDEPSAVLGISHVSQSRNSISFRYQLTCTLASPLRRFANKNKRIVCFWARIKSNNEFNQQCCIWANPSL